MKCMHLTAVLVFCTMTARSQQDTLREKTLKEVVVSANKFEERKRNINQKIDVITQQNISAANTQNTGDLLIKSGNVFVQKSQQGGSSPVLRGFEASRVLLVIDGVRMNNAIYRGGHLQNVITVDQNMLERVEVLFGPASTLYGSDALGGVIHLRTKSPRLSLTDKIRTTGTLFARYSSNNHEKTTHFDISLGGRRFSWIQSLTYSDFGDLKMGTHYPKKYPDFGKRSYYITSINGIDSVVKNADDRVQKYSGYKQWDILDKFFFRQSEKITHSLNLQLSNSNDVPRYDRLQDIRNGTLRFAKWYYGPQTRWMGSYELNANSDGFFNQIRLNLNYQHIVESRNQREYRRYDRLDSREETLDVWGFILDTRKKWANHEITIGADGQLNNLSSVANRINTVTGEKSSLDTRYPDGKNRMTYLGIYAQHLLKLFDEKMIINDGIRVNGVFLHSRIEDNSFFNLPFTSIKQDNLAVTANLGMVYIPKEDFRVLIGLSSGFRNPNIDDLSKIFESSTALGRVVVPNPHLKPEYTYNLETGIEQRIRENIRFEITGFYTLFRNAIALAPFALNNQDSILYNGVLSAVYANRNVNRAYTYGFNTNLEVKFSSRFTFFSAVTYTYGRYRHADGTKTPQDHIPPVFGKGSLKYNTHMIETEIYSLFNGWKKIRDYNPDGEDNQQYATPDGMPSWVTLNWRIDLNLSARTQVQFAIENIFDRNYRYFASGFSAGGRNFILAVRTGF